MALALRGQGSAGDMKWMLNDVPYGASASENNLGVFDTSDQPKSIFFASQAASTYFGASQQQGNVVLAPDARAGVSFVYMAGDAFATSRIAYQDSRLRYATLGDAPGQVWLTWVRTGHLDVMATQAATITVDLHALANAADPPMPTISPAGTIASAHGPWLTLLLQPGVHVDVAYQLAPSPTPSATALATTSPTETRAMPTPRPTMPILSDDGVNAVIMSQFLHHYHSTLSVTVPALRLRTGPSFQARQIAVITQHTRLGLLGSSGSWLHVALAANMSGWVDGEYVSKDAVTTNAPPAMRAPAAPPVGATSTAIAPPGLPTPVAPATQVLPAAGAKRTAKPVGTTHTVDISRLGPLAEVLADGVHVRQGPRLGATSLFYAYRGSMVAVRQIHVSWVQVTFANGKTGWILGHYLRMPAIPTAPTGTPVAVRTTPATVHVTPTTQRQTPTPTATATARTVDIARLGPRAVVLTDGVRVRQEPRLSADVLFLTYRGVPVAVRQIHISWVQVTFTDGKTGWILGHYLRMPASTPLQTPTPARASTSEAGAVLHAAATPGKFGSGTGSAKRYYVWAVTLNVRDCAATHGQCGGPGWKEYDGAGPGHARELEPCAATEWQSWVGAHPLY